MSHRIGRRPTSQTSQRKRQTLRRSTLLILSASLCTWSSTALGQQWANPNSGNWSDDSNWTAGVPTEFDNAVINATGGNYQVDLNTDQSVASLTIDSGNATLFHSSGALSLGNALVLSSGTYNLTGGSIAASPSGLSMTVGGGTGFATFIINSSSSMSLGASDNLNLQAGSLHTDGTLTNNGTMSVNGSNLIATGAFTNQNGGELTLQNGTSLFEGPVTNSGLINAMGSEQLKINTASNLANSGSFFVDSSNLIVSGAITNQSGGVLSVQNSSTMSIDGSLTNSGTFTVDLSNLDVTGSLTNSSSGAMNLLSSQVNMMSGSTLNNSGVLSIQNGASLYLLSGSSTTFASTGSLEGTGTLINQTGSTQEIDGNISPGDSAQSIGSLTLLGDFALGNSATTTIQIDGSGSDAIFANDSFFASGNLNVSLINGFTLQDGLSWDFLTVASTFTGQFNNLGQDSLVGSFNGYDLRIDYNTGSGARLYSQISAVPEPSSLAFLGIATCGAIVFRGVRRKSKSREKDIS